MVIGILGGDFRYKFLYEILSQENYLVYIYENKYIEDKDNIKSLDEFFNRIDVLVGSIPFSKDNKISFNDKSINIDEFIKKLKTYNIKTLFAGAIEKNIIKKLNDNNIKTFDFFEDNYIAILNAIPTAEGAIQTAMENSFKTLFNSNSLVLGYGRCGKILSNMLKGIGANVDVSYRKEEDLSYIKSYGLSPINLYKIKDSIKKYDFIFNTIPYEILSKEILTNVNKDVVIIDLASAPGGVDYSYARELNIKAIYCPSLPGRVAPYTAANILKDKILSTLNI